MTLRLGSRIVVVGVTGSGKTTTAQRLAGIFGLPHVELDGLYWDPHWTAVEKETFLSRVDRALSGEHWVTDGNYNSARSIIWSRAETLVWLDYPLPVILWQLTWRTLRRIKTREELWNGNYETWRGAFFSGDSLFLFAIKSKRKQSILFRQALEQPEYAHLRVIHLFSRQEADRWLTSLQIPEN